MIAGAAMWFVEGMTSCIEMQHCPPLPSPKVDAAGRKVQISKRKGKIYCFEDFNYFAQVEAGLFFGLYRLWNMQQGLFSMLGPPWARVAGPCGREPLESFQMEQAVPVPDCA